MAFIIQCLRVEYTIGNFSFQSILTVPTDYGRSLNSIPRSRLRRIRHQSIIVRLPASTFSCNCIIPLGRRVHLCGSDSPRTVLESRRATNDPNSTLHALTHSRISQESY
jgi:hypothetical protein